MGYMIYRISVFESDIQHSIEHTYKTKYMYLYGESGVLKYGKYGDEPRRIDFIAYFSALRPYLICGPQRSRSKKHDRSALHRVNWPNNSAG